MKVVIAGAGLGGLCLAQGLRSRGVEVIVYERDAALLSRRQGYRIHIDGDGDRALAVTLPPNLYELFRATSYEPLPRTPVFDHRLRRLAMVESDDSDRHVSVNRLTLRQILLHGMQDSVRFGRKVVGYAVDGGVDGGAVTVRLDDGTTDAAEVLVAADGVHSLVRRQYLPHQRIVDTGVRQLYGRVVLDAATRQLLLPEMYAVFTPITGPDQAYVGIGPVDYPQSPAAAAARLAPGLTLYETDSYVTVSYGARREVLPELGGLTGEQLRGLALERTEGWHPRVRDLLGRWQPDSVFPLALRSSVPIDAWRPSRITLLGDAIHAMSPAAGVGANTALRDAATLTTALTATGRLSVVEAIADYETAMVGYGFAAVRRSAVNGHRMLGQDLLPTT